LIGKNDGGMGGRGEMYRIPATDRSSVGVCSEVASVTEQAS
jgi:hypothetical protein